MGAAAGGRLTLWLLGLAVLIASGATGIAVTHDGSAPSQRGGSGSAQMRGSSDQRPDRGQSATVQAQARPRSPAPVAARDRAQAAAAAAAETAAVRRTGRYNVGATHSPELL
ncbi:MAG TPA: hypothetical protein VN847_00820, partial [Streptosporangiaceae bacterium]|nr:hypothetical protein [Streptosporangiaceae bacterium]